MRLNLENISLLAWMKRLAAAGFFLFLIKGLIWLGIALAVALWGLN